MKRAPKKKRSSAKKRSGKRPVTKVAPPPGWETIEEFEPQVEEPQDPVGQMRLCLVWQVRTGLRSDKKIVQSLVDMWSDEIPEKRIRAEAKKALPPAHADHATEQLGWPKVTDCDRLDKAFAELEKRGVLARQDYWCCGTCGCAAIDDEMNEAARKKKPSRGYAFFHEQDTQAVVEYGGLLMLNYGVLEGTDRDVKAIGKEIVSVLKKHGLKPKWSGKVEERIAVKMDWKRRG